MRQIVRFHYIDGGHRVIACRHKVCPHEGQAVLIPLPSALAQPRMTTVEVFDAQSNPTEPGNEDYQGP